MMCVVDLDVMMIGWKSRQAISCEEAIMCLSHCPENRMYVVFVIFVLYQQSALHSINLKYKIYILFIIYYSQ